MQRTTYACWLTSLFLLLLPSGGGCERQPPAPPTAERAATDDGAAESAAEAPVATKAPVAVPGTGEAKSDPAAAAATKPMPPTLPADLRQWLVAAASDDEAAHEPAMAALDQQTTAVIAMWAVIFQDPDVSVRRGGARFLVRMRDPRALAAVGLALDDSDPVVRHAALQAARQLDKNELARVRAQLAALLDPQREDDTYRTVTAQLLGSIQGEAADIVPALERAARRDPAAKVRQAAIYALERLAPPEQTAATLGAVVETDPDAVVRRLAVVRLGRMPVFTDKTVTAVATALRDADDAVRQEAVTAMVYFGPPAVPVLVVQLRDGDQSVRKLALFALGKLGRVAAPAAAAVEALANDAQLSAELREQARTVLSVIQPRS